MWRSPLSLGWGFSTQGRSRRRIRPERYNADSNPRPYRVADPLQRKARGKERKKKEATGEPYWLQVIETIHRSTRKTRYPLMSNVSVLDHRDRIRVGSINSYVRNQAHARQFARPNWERLSRIPAVCGRRCFLPFASIRRPPTSVIPIAVCRAAFAHVIAVEHRRPGSWRLVECRRAITPRTSTRRRKA